MDKSTAGNGGSCRCGGIDAAERETLDRYAITRVPAATYLRDGYRYTSLTDAVAQARRSGM